jgi:NADH-dependent peroxiredoxin subunit C
MLTINDTIPQITAEVFHKEKIKKISLSKYKKKWLILLFYPADFTFVCPTELREAADYYSEVKKLNTEIISVSTDTAFVHKAWHDNSELISGVKFPMLADPTGQICKTFGTYIEDEGLSLRATFIIDPDQKIVSIEKHDNSIGRNISETLRKLQAAQFVRENKTLVCPASWKPGEKTLKPGVNLVGKI